MAVKKWWFLFGEKKKLYLLEKEMATHPSILAWEIPWTEESGRLLSMVPQKSWRWFNKQEQLMACSRALARTLSLSLSLSLYIYIYIYIFGEGNSTPLQCSCLENPRDSGAWVGFSPWGHKELDMTERLTLSLFKCSWRVGGDWLFLWEGCSLE